MTGGEGDENDVKGSKPVQSRTKEKNRTSKTVLCQQYSLLSFPVPAIGCKQSTPSSMLTAAPVAPHPPELEVQDAEALESP